MTIIIGLDISSTNIGAVVLALDETLHHRQHFDLIKLAKVGGKDTLERRVWVAQRALKALLATWHRGRSIIAYESNSFGTGYAMRGQWAVIGPVLALAVDHGIELCPVHNGTAKKALSGKGNATKEQMVEAAQARYHEALGEHEADACGIALAAIAELAAPKLPKMKPKRRKKAA